MGVQELLREVSNLACDAMTCDCESVKAHALGDIMYRIGKEIPAKYRMKEAVGPGTKVARTPKTLVAERTLTTGRTVSMDVDLYGDGKRTYIYDGQKCVCRIDFFDEYQSSGTTYKVSFGAYRGLVSKLIHGSRRRANRKTRAVRQLTVADELAATVARQSGDDETARSIEFGESN